MGEKGVEDMMKSIAKFDNVIEKNLRDTFDRLLTRFRLEERVTLGSRDRKKEDTYLPYDSKRKSMKYTQMAKLKDF